MTEKDEQMYSKLVIGFGTNRVIYVKEIKNGWNDMITGKQRFADIDTLEKLGDRPISVTLTSDADDATNFRKKEDGIRFANWFRDRMGAKIYELVKTATVTLQEQKQE
ncbi:MAG: hypothetical protein ABF913_04840 [Oenococcus sp.]|uniref:hypothetical protein n=1 Tax=Oenococcus sp. TaxID=1979414 RepID=UPI0039E7A2D8